MSNVQIAGIANFLVDGIFYDVASDLTYSTNSTSKEPLVGQSGTQGYKTTFVYGFMSANFRDTGNLTTQFFEALSNVTCTAQLANGKTILGVNMFVSDVQTVKTDDSTFEVRFNGTVLAI
jgi:Phage tail tube protein